MRRVDSTRILLAPMLVEQPKKTFRNVIANEPLALVAVFLLMISGFSTWMLLSRAPRAVATLDTPMLITYQGKLTDANRITVPDSALNMKFAIYTSSSGASGCVWSAGDAGADDVVFSQSEDCPSHVPNTALSVTPSEGVVTVILGASPQNAIPDALFDDNSALYLGVTVGADSEMTPRIRLTATPYAFQAGDADLLDGLDSTAFLTTSTAWTLDGTSQTVTADKDMTLSGGVNGFSFDGTTFSVDAANDRIGIGDATPAATLTVGASDAFQVNSSGYVTLPAGSLASPSLNFSGETDTGLSEATIAGSGVPGPALFISINGVQAGLIGIAATPVQNSYGNTVLGYGSGLVLDLTGGGTGDDAVNNTFIGAETGTKVTTAMQNTYVGSRAGHENVTGSENTCVGQGSCYENVAGTITAMGYHSHLNHTGGTLGGNVAVGWKAMEGVSTALATGVQNVAIGYEAGLVSGSAVGNVLLGYRAGTAVTTGGKNVLVGWSAGDSVTTGVDSVIIGREAGQALTSENGNVVIGGAAGNVLTDVDNVLVGWAAGQVMTTATKNTAIGRFAGLAITTGDNNTFLGSDADSSSATRANAIAIGSGATVAADNSVQLGNASVTALTLGSGAKLAVGASEIAFNDGSADVDFRVETDGNANGIFLDASAETIDLVGGSGSTGCSIDGSGNLACSGSADGTDALTLTAGDILVTNGDLDLSGGDFNVVLDAGDGVNISKGAAPTADVFSINSGTSATDGVDGLQLTFTASAASGNGIDITPSFADATAGATNESFNVIDIDAFTATINATGDTDTIRGLNIGTLTQTETAGTLTADAILIGTGWDCAFKVDTTCVIDGTGSFSAAGGWTDGGTDVTLTTSTDNVGIGGASLAKFSVDGDTDEIQFLVQGNTSQTANYVTVETSAGTDLFQIDTSGNVILTNDLGVGAAASSETLANTGFAPNGDDLFVADSIGAEGNVYTDGSFIAGSTLTLSDSGITESGAFTFTSQLASGGTTSSAYNLVSSNDLGAADELLQIGDSAATFATILGNGNVGIGDATPDFLLDVAGTLGVDGNVTLGDASGDTVTSNAGTWTFANATTVNSTGDIDFVPAGGTDGFTIDGTTFNVDEDNDRIGIGTASPSTILDIAKVGSGSTAAQVTISGYANDASSGAYMNWQKSRGTSVGSLVTTESGDFLGVMGWAGVTSSNTSNYGARILVQQDAAASSTQVPGAFTIRTSSASAESERLRITSSGNVGIGDTTPASLLTVGDGDDFQVGSDGDLDSIKSVAYSWPSANASGVLTNNGSGTLSWSAAGAGDITAVGSMTSGDAFADATADDDWLGLGAAAGRIEFDDQATDEVNILDANVGIGDATPDYLLDVAGTLGVDGNITLGDAGADTVTSNAAAWTFASDTTVALSGGTNGINFDSDTLSIDATNNFVGIGTNTPDYLLQAEASSASAQFAVVTNTNTAGAGVVMAQAGNVTARYAAYGTTAAINNFASGTAAFFGSGAVTSVQMVTPDVAAPLAFGYNDFVSTSREFLRLTDGTAGAVFNEDSLDRDFRVEGDTNANLLFLDASADRVGIGDATPEHFVDIEAGSLASAVQAFSVTGTLSSSAAVQTGASVSTTSAGSASFGQQGLYNLMAAGYTGSSSTFAFATQDLAAGTNTGAANGYGSSGEGGNYGTYSQTNVSTSGNNVGVFGTAEQSASLNIGGLFHAMDSNGSPPYNVGLVGRGGSGTTASVGGYFDLVGSPASPSFTSAALLVDNNAISSPIFLARDNGTVVFTIADGGSVGVGDSTPDALLEVSGSSGAILMSTNAGTGASLRVNDDGTDSDTTPFIVDPDGDVGIGEPTPTANLQILSAKTTGIALRVDADSITAGTAFKLDVDGLTTTGIGMYIESNHGTRTDGFLMDVADLGTTYSATATLAGDTARMRQTIANTAGTLTLSGNTLDLSRTATAGSGATITETGAVLDVSDADGGGAGTLTSSNDAARIAHNNTSNSGTALNVAYGGTGFAFRVNDTTSFTDSSPFVIDDNGYVYIGTTSPSVTDMLYISSPNASEGITINNTAADGDAVVRFALSGTNTWAMGLDDGLNDNFEIVAGTGLSAATPVITATTGGDVGIGDDTPSAKLDVAGQINSTALAVSGVNGAYVGDGTSKIWLGGSGGANYLESGNEAWNASATLNITGYNGTSGTFVFTGNVGVGTSPGQELDVAGQIQFDISTAGDTTIGVCKNNADGTSANTEFVECSGTPGDVAEWYETTGAEAAGDLVAVGSTVLAYVEELFDPATGLPTGSSANYEAAVVEKSSAAYASKLFGVVSTSPLQTMGEAVKDAATNPQPIAISGRVPTKVNVENGAIAAGDPITSSSTSGVGMKATQPGAIVGYALDDWAGPGQGTVMVFVSPGFHLADAIEQGPTGTASSGTPGIDSFGLALRGSGWDGAAAQERAMKLVTDVTDASTYKLSIRNQADAEVAYITDDGVMSVASDVIVGGKLYPSALGVAQTDKYVYYGGSGDDYMRTNASGWGTGSYDFAEMFPSSQPLVPGEVVAFDTASEFVKRASGEDAIRLAGIVSTKPGFLAGTKEANTYPIALAGRVPTKVSLENGDIAVGDALTVSATRPGYAMKAEEAGMIVGYALEPAAEDGSVITFVHLGYWPGSGSRPDAGTDNTASAFSGDLTALTMNGNIYMQGNQILNVGAIAGLGGAWSVDASGKFATEGSYKVVITSYQNEKVETVAPLSLEHKVTLSGAGTLSGGTATVVFEEVAPSFNDITSTTAPVRVLVTLRGPANGIYVEAADRNGFTARETMGGASDAEFDWYVEAYRKDFDPPVVVEVLPEEPPAVEEPPVEPPPVEPAP